MRSSRLTLCCAAVMLLLLSACGAADNSYTGAQYSSTNRVETIFHVSQSPSSCRVFAHLFATMPARMTAQDFGSQLTTEARLKGADLILIGQSRHSTEDSALNYCYQGPGQEYNINQWHGWSFGFDQWSEQGRWASFGYDEWMKSSIHYDYPVKMQVAFLRCQD